MVPANQALVQVLGLAAYKTLIWERSRHLPRLRYTLRESFPAALVAFDALAAADTLELLAAAPDPAAAAALSVDTIEAALKRARRRGRVAKAQAIAEALRAEHLGQPQVVATDYAVTVRAQAAILVVLNEQIAAMPSHLLVNAGAHGLRPAPGALTRWMPVRDCHMLVDDFWQIVELARSDAGVTDDRLSADAVATALTERLAALPLDDILDFDEQYHEVIRRLHQWEMCAGVLPHHRLYLRRHLHRLQGRSDRHGADRLRTDRCGSGRRTG